MDSLLDLSKRTVTKIIYRLKLSCSRCGWNEANGDIHHIIPRSKGGTNDHSNLTYLCPNCHRLAHSKGITNFISIEEQIGDSWKDVYFPEKAGLIRLYSEESIKEMKRGAEIARLKKKQKYLEKIPEKVSLLRNSNVDYSKYGWCSEVSLIIGISSQKVRGWMKIHTPDLLDGAKTRK